MEFSVTELEGIKRCNRSGEFSSFNGLGFSKLESPVYFTTGTVWHASHKDWLLEPDRNFQEITWLNMQAEIKAIKERYQARLGREPSDSEMAGPYTALGILPFMAKNYQEVWKTPLPDGYRCVSPEQTLVVPIPHRCNNCLCCPKEDRSPAIPYCDGDACEYDACTICRHSLELTLDALIENTETGRLLILERKTYNSRPNKDILRNNNQFLRYQWGANHYGLDIAGVAYDGAWKRKGPTKKGMSLDDMFLRTTILRSPQEVANETEAIQRDVEDAYKIISEARQYRELHPDVFYMYPKYFVPWNGCFDCSIRPLCESYRKGNASLFTMFERDYGPRTKNVGVADLDTD